MNSSTAEGALLRSLTALSRSRCDCVLVGPPLQGPMRMGCLSQAEPEQQQYAQEGGHPDPEWGLALGLGCSSQSRSDPRCERGRGSQVTQMKC